MAPPVVNDLESTAYYFDHANMSGYHLTRCIIQAILEWGVYYSRISQKSSPVPAERTITCGSNAKPQLIKLLIAPSNLMEPGSLPAAALALASPGNAGIRCAIADSLDWRSLSIQHFPVCPYKRLEDRRLENEHSKWVDYITLLLSMALYVLKINILERDDS